MQTIIENHRERELIARAVSRTEEYLCALSTETPSVITIVDSKGFNLFLGLTLEEVFGYKIEERLIRSPFECIREDDGADVRDGLHCLLANPKSTLSVEYQYRRADGLWRIVESVGRIPFGTADLLGVKVVSHDITEQRQKEIALRESLGELFEMISTRGWSGQTNRCPGRKRKGDSNNYIEITLNGQDGYRTPMENLIKMCRLISEDYCSVPLQMWLQCMVGLNVRSMPERSQTLASSHQSSTRGVVLTHPAWLANQTLLNDSSFPQKKRRRKFTREQIPVEVYRLMTRKYRSAETLNRMYEAIMEIVAEDDLN